jgi:hypothetical protein
MQLSSAPLSLHDWHEFYVFRYSSGGARRPAICRRLDRRRLAKPERASATKTFLSPIVIHFTSVLLISAIALTPESAPLMIVTVLALNAVVGTIIGFVVFPGAPFKS